jgi:hypothetical protein
MVQLIMVDRNCGELGEVGASITMRYKMSTFYSAFAIDLRSAQGVHNMKHPTIAVDQGMLGCAKS